jgi:uncharacterized protein YbjT (DUF2867 family)
VRLPSRAVARVLIVGCGCRGLELARALRADGHAVRGTTRDPARAELLRAAGVEPWVGDPDRVGSLVYAMQSVTVVCWLLGRVPSPDLHGPRLAMMLAKTVDTTVRGFAYEPPADQNLRIGGLTRLSRAHESWEIPVSVVAGSPLQAIHTLLD